MGPGNRKVKQMTSSENSLSPSNKIVTSEASRCDLSGIIRGLLFRAALWSLAFGVAHLFGLRTYTSLLSGTGSLSPLESVYGAIYLVLYAGFVTLIPTLLIAAGLLKLIALISSLCTGSDNHRESSDIGVQQTRA